MDFDLLRVSPPHHAMYFTNISDGSSVLGTGSLSKKNFFWQLGEGQSFFLGLLDLDYLSAANCARRWSSSSSIMNAGRGVLQLACGISKPKAPIMPEKTSLSPSVNAQLVGQS